MSRGSLWRHRDFLCLWTGQTISQLGSQVTALALPVLAAVQLQATPAQMGLLGALEMAPFLLFSLPAGAWVDRLPKRAVLVAADLGRALVVGALPLAAWLGVLDMRWLYAGGFLAGVLTVLFEVAYQAYLPAPVGRPHLLEANARLETSRSAAQLVGPGLAGALVEWLTAPVAVLVDAASYLASAAALAAIRTPEPRPEAARRSLGSDVVEGLRLVLGNPLLRRLAACTGTSNLFGSVGGAVFILFATRQLGLGPGTLGLVFAVAHVGFLVGAAAAARVARRLGLGRTLVLSPMVWGAGSLRVALAGGPPPWPLAALAAGQFLAGLATPVYNVNQVSLRQSLVPLALQARLAATMRFFVWGTIPLGSLLGGLLGEVVGLRPTLVLGALGSGLAALWLFRSPVAALREPPVPAEAGAPAAGSA